ncbi:MAG: hypothetical protein LUQ12_01205 [Methanoregulaceae archaeon]|nr:hypothetical protein [Methanoregulaceae archaeon]
MTGKRVVIVGVIILVAMVCLTGCIAPPKGNPEQNNAQGGTGGIQGGGGIAGTPTPTQVPIETGFITPATPFPVVTTPASGTSGTRLPDVTPVATEYVAIYYNTIALKNNRTAYNYDLKRPPLVIEMCFFPNMTSRTIWYESNTGEREERTETVTTISPYAWFEVTVRDPVTGQVIAEEGFSRGYGTETGKDLTIRSPGKYLIEFSGNEIRTEIQIKVPKTEVQTGELLRNMSCSI